MRLLRATRGRRRGMLGAAAVLALAALLVSSCGEDSNSGLSSRRAADLESSLDSVEARVEARDCTAAATQATSFARRVDSLPSRVDRDLRDALEQSAARLEALVDQQCRPEAAEEPQVQEPTVTDETQQDEDQQGKKPKKPKKPKEEESDTGTTGTTGTTGSTGPTGATGFDGGAAIPGE